MESKDKHIIISAICDAIDDHQENKIDRNVGMFLEIGSKLESILNSDLISRSGAIAELEGMKPEMSLDKRKQVERKTLIEAIERLKNLK